MRFGIHSLLLSQWILAANLAFGANALPNGLMWNVWREARLPLVQVSLGLRVGQRDEPAGKWGVSRLWSQLLYHSYAEDLERTGTKRIFSIDEDASGIHLTGLATELPELLDYLDRLITKPQFKEADFLREKAKLLEIFSQLKHQPNALVLYGMDTLRGAKANLNELKRLSLGDVVNFHRQQVVPGNAMLLVAGRVDEEVLSRLIGSGLGVHWKGSVPVRGASKKIASSQRRNQKQALFISAVGATQSRIRMGWAVPGPQDPDRVSLVVANALLGEMFESRLNRALRDENQIVNSVQSSLGFRSDEGFWTIDLLTPTAMTREALERAQKVVRNFAEGPLDLDEVNQAKEYLRGSYQVSQSGSAVAAMRWMTGWVLGLEDGTLNEFLPQLELVDADRVRKALDRHLKRAQFFVVVSGDPVVWKDLAKISTARGWSRLEAKDLP